MMTPSLSGAPLAHAAVPAFVTSGRALFTLVGKSTRFTFKVEAPKRDRNTGDKVAPEKSPVRFVKVLTGPDNESSYTFLGTVFEDGTYRSSNKSPIGPDAPSAIAATWFFSKVKAVAFGQATLPAALEVWHHGKCCRCGRTLTVPSSIHNGVGPECLKRRG